MKDKELFKKIKEKYDDEVEFPFSPTDREWSDLEARLHKKPRRRFAFLWRGAAASLLLLSFGLGWVFRSQDLSQQAKKDQQEEQVIYPSSDEDLTEKYDDIPIGKNQEENTLKENQSKPIFKPINERIEKKSTIKKSPTSTAIAENNYRSAEKNSNPNNTILYPQYDIKSNSDSKPGDIPQSSPSKENGFEYPSKLNLEKQEALLADIGPLSTQVEVLPQLIEQKLYAQPNTTMRKNDGSKRLGYGIALQPMTSAIALNEIGDFGTAMGGNLNYSVSDNFEIHLNVHYSKQNYALEGDDYSGVDDYWTYFTNDELPLDVNAYNEVIEFPLSLQYKFFSSDSQNVRAGIGLHNQIKMFEKHNFDFGDYGNPYNQESWQIGDDEWQIANGLRLQAVYDAYLTEKLRISVSPFFDVPFQKNAWGNLTINNKGLGITISPQ